MKLELRVGVGGWGGGPNPCAQVKIGYRFPPLFGREYNARFVSQSNSTQKINQVNHISKQPYEAGA